jgi:hypothetical protein
MHVTVKPLPSGPVAQAAGVHDDAACGTALAVIKYAGVVHFGSL